MIYLDNAATTQTKPEEVIEAVTDAMRRLGNAGRGAHGASLGASRTIFDTRVLLQEFFGAEDPRCMVFTANSTESLNIAIKGVLSKGDHVIATVLDHNSVLRPIYSLEDQGIEHSFVGADPLQNPVYEDFEMLVRPNTKAIVCTHGSNVTGNLVDIERISRIAHAHNLLFIVDASQTAGVFPIDVQAMGIDILCFTGHKGLLGPQGTGGMYVRTGIEVKPFLHGGTGVQSYNEHQPSEMPTRLEAGTLNGHGIAGLDAAIRYINRVGMDNIRETEMTLMKQFYEGVKDIPGVKLYGDFSSFHRCGIVGLNIDDYDSSEVSDELYTRFDIATRPGAHCAPLMHKSMGTVEQGLVRFSFSHFNTAEEIEKAVKAIYTLATE